MRKQSGFTLIELLISLLIISFMIATVLFTYSKNREINTLQDQRGRIQENLRLAAEKMAREIRQARFRGCLSDKMTADVRLGATVTNFAIRNALLTTAPIMGIDEVRTNPVLTLATGNTLGTANGVQANDYTIGDFENLPLATTFDGATAGSTGTKIMVPDRLYLQTVIGGPANPTGAVPAGTALNLNRPLLEADPSGTGNVTRFILIADCANRRGELIEVSAGRQNLTLVNALQFPYTAAAQVYEVAFLQYDIYEATIGGRPVLSLGRRPLDAGDNRQSIVPHVENLQILYGLDTDPSDTGVAIRYVPATQVTTLGRWQDVVALQITLVGRADKGRAYTNSGNLDFSQLRYLMPGSVLGTAEPQFVEPKDVGGNFEDNFVPRQSLTFRIALRN